MHMISSEPFSRPTEQKLETVSFAPNSLALGLPYYLATRENVRILLLIAKIFALFLDAS